jgi:hypothetical protein
MLGARGQQQIAQRPRPEREHTFRATGPPHVATQIAEGARHLVAIGAAE